MNATAQRRRPDTQIPPLEKFNDLIHQQANYCWHRLPNPKPCEYEDLKSEGTLAYLEAAESFNPRLGIKFITYYHRGLKWHMIAILQSAYKHKRIEPTEDNLLDIPCYHKRHVRVKQPFYQNLSRLAWLFVREFLDPSDDFVDFCSSRYRRDTRSPLVLKRRVCEYLGFTPKQAKTVVAELRIKLSRGVVDGV